MATYSYFAKSLEGKEEVGEVEARSEKEVAQILKAKGYILIKAEVVGEKKKRKFPSLFFWRRVSITEKIMFTRNLRVMISAGVSLPKALSTLSQLVRSRIFKEALLKIAQKIEKGESLSKSLAEFPNIFSELFVSCVEIGEESGTLEESLKILTEHMEKEYELRSKIVGALIYPAVIITVLILIGALMLIIVVPKLKEVFLELGVELPPTTKFVIFLGSFLANYKFFLPFVLLFAIIGFKMILATKTGKTVFDFLPLKIPIISSLAIKSNCAFIIRTLSALITAGIPLVRSLEIISNATTNVYYKASLKEAVRGVRRGIKLSEVLKKYPQIYPLLVHQMLTVGEETGQTAEILGKLAEFYEEEVDNATKALTSIIEPVIMVLIGGAIGFFAVSMIQPMYSMLEGLK